jgi:hypothetical protein
VANFILIFREVEIQWEESEKIQKKCARMSYRNAIQNLVTKVRVTGTLIERNPEHQYQLLTEEKLDETGDQLQHSSRKFLKRLAQKI